MSEILGLATDYFWTHLNDNATATCTTIDEDQAHILSFVSQQLSMEDSTWIDLPITQTEVKFAIKGMPQAGTPGPDGIPSEFYSIFSNLAVPLLTKGFKKAWTIGHLPSDFLRGDTVLLPKKGDNSLLVNKRPITLLNCKYKVYATLWHVRLTDIAQDIIDWNQTAFLPTRSIHHSVFLCSEVLHYCSVAQIPVVFVKIDFNKA
jgi:hypothetical protein